MSRGISSLLLRDLVINPPKRGGGYCIAISSPFKLMMNTRAQNSRLFSIKGHFAMVAKTPAEVEMISIDEFRKIELRVATIKHAEPHPNADRLMVLKIDLGSEERQLVAGIKEHYLADDLVGKQIVVIVNLEPAKLRGIESQGMMLAATDDDKIVILNPEKPVRPGAKVS